MLLYTLMGISAYRIYMKNPKAEALKLYLIQLAVNFLWSIFFFNLGWQLFAAVWILLLWYLV
ncbi:MAG: tryptophan-rich sensory protein, partial [Blautia sp.]